MPTPTYTPLANLTLGAAASSVTFSSIPATYRDLICVVVPKSSTTGDTLLMRFNGDQNNHYSNQFMRGNGSTASAVSNTTSTGFGLCSTALNRNTTGLQTISNIMDYSVNNKHKTAITRASNGSTGVDAIVGRWPNTAIVTSITILPTTGTITAGSTFALYGVIA
jgi:hypothetical protein